MLSRMTLLWTRTFAILRFETPGFEGGPDESAWPWVTVSPDVTLLDMGVGDEGYLPADEGSEALVRAYLRARLWCDGIGQAAEDHPFVAHDDPRGILIAPDTRVIGEAHEHSPADALRTSHASYDTWTSTLSGWGFWIAKPESTEQCLREIEAVIGPADRENALRTRQQYPHQYASDPAWLELMTAFVGRALAARVRGA